MKIFNWVHRRFSHKEGPKKSDPTNENDNQLAQECNDFRQVLDGWRGGILTIGTFGYDPLKDEAEHYGTPFYDEEPNKAQAENESSDSEEEEEANPLVFAAYEHDYEGLILEMEAGNRVFEKDDFKKERTTLAELFSAELQEKQGLEKGEKRVKENRLKKKVIGHQDDRPIHKLHRLMRRMLKRKIHPDQTPNKHNPINSSKLVPKKCEPTSDDDSASLLSTKVAGA